MKKKSLVLTLTIILGVGLGATAYAAAAAPANSYCQGAGLGRLEGFTGYDIITNILKDKGVTDSEITDALNSGKTLSDLAEENGITSDELKQSLLDEKIKIIDDAVDEGTLSKEQGEVSKAAVTKNITTCPGPGQMRGRTGGQNRGRGMGGGRCLYNSNLSK